ncbi:RNA polymerase sigma factor [Roseovarius phycicola]|uniref:RNA polymerase sigma factor n=1 Tax=Roseovarius phycicola TaxID=3080976 RepID=A0ABZ2HKK2_9RHOB
MALTGQRALGDDLAQMTCLRALEKADQFTPGTHLDRWLFVMARRLWLNELRRDAIRQTESFSANADDQHPAEIPSTETNIMAREVFQKMNALPEAQRVTALLVFVEGYTYAETADMLDIPPGTVMSRISAARKTLATQMEAATGTDA